MTDPELALKKHLRPRLQDELALGRLAYDEAWEQWMLVRYMLMHYVQAVDKRSVDGPWGPLLVATGYRPTVAPATEAFRRHLARASDGDGLLSHGLLGGSKETSEIGLVTFENRFPDWAIERSQSLRGDGVVSIEGGTKYPGRPGLAVPGS